MATTLIITISTFVIMILSILLFPNFKIGKMKIDTYWIVTLLGALLLFACQKISLSDYVDELTSSTAINPLKIIVLFFSMSILSIILDELGFFKYVASLAINKANSSQFSIFTILFFVISILTVFTSNDIVILTFTPFICYFCKATKINPIPYLISEFVAANTLSMALLIGNPTNIYLSLSANITFMDYFKVMFWRSCIVCLISYGLLFLIFYKELKKPIIKEKQDLKFNGKIPVFVALGHLLVCTILMAVSSYLDFEMYLISLIFAGSLVLFILIYELITKEKGFIVLHSLRRLPYALVPFLLSMFAIVSSLANCGIIDKLATSLNNSSPVWTIGGTSFISCSFMNNIPMSVLFSKILATSSFSIKSIYAAIVGSNLGAIFTPIGALAGIMWLDIIHKQNIKLTFFDFIKYGMPVSITLMAATLLLLII